MNGPYIQVDISPTDLANYLCQIELPYHWVTEDLDGSTRDMIEDEAMVFSLIVDGERTGTSMSLKKNGKTVIWARLPVPT